MLEGLTWSIDPRGGATIYENTYAAKVTEFDETWSVINYEKCLRYVSFCLFVSFIYSH
jgi:hypothetical protein